MLFTAPMCIPFSLPSILIASNVFGWQGNVVDDICCFILHHPLAAFPVVGASATVYKSYGVAGALMPKVSLMSLCWLIGFPHSNKLRIHASAYCLSCLLRHPLQRHAKAPT